MIFGVLVSKHVSVSVEGNRACRDTRNDRLVLRQRDRHCSSSAAVGATGALIVGTKSHMAFQIVMLSPAM